MNFNIPFTKHAIIPRDDIEGWFNQLDTLRKEIVDLNKFIRDLELAKVGLDRDGTFPYEVRAIVTIDPMMVAAAKDGKAIPYPAMVHLSRNVTANIIDLLRRLKGDMSVYEELGP